MARAVGKRSVRPRSLDPRIIFSERKPGSVSPKGELIITVFSRPNAVRFAKDLLVDRRGGIVTIEKKRRIFGRGSQWTIRHRSN